MLKILVALYALGVWIVIQFKIAAESENASKMEWYEVFTLPALGIAFLLLLKLVAEIL